MKQEFRFSWNLDNGCVSVQLYTLIVRLCLCVHVHVC